VAPESLKRTLRRLFTLAGLEVRRRRVPSAQGNYRRGSPSGLLHHAKNVGLSPATVVDVGAAYGEFTVECHRVFPDANYILVEPLEEYRPFLEAVSRSVPKTQYVLAAASAVSGELVINVHPDLVGSSVYLEEESSNVNGVPRMVPAIALDSLADDRGAMPPFLLKIDVQGAELDVLSGGEELLQSAEYVLLEASFFEFFRTGPQFHDVVTFMESRGFVTYDICGLQYRPLDNALSQIDIAFVKEKGFLREHHQYATPRQREEQNRTFRLRKREVPKAERQS
jgi:FkbM family methyltransferase